MIRRALLVGISCLLWVLGRPGEAHSAARQQLGIFGLCTLHTPNQTERLRKGLEAPWGDAKNQFGTEVLAACLYALLDQRDPQTLDAALHKPGLLKGAGFIRSDVLTLEFQDAEMHVLEQLMPLLREAYAQKLPGRDGLHSASRCKTLLEKSDASCARPWRCASACRCSASDLPGCRSD